MILDDELKEIFKTEFEENIQILNQELLKLEKNKEDLEALTKLMRVAHSMKGGARMIGLSGVVDLAHFFEDMLGEVKKKNTLLNASDFNAMYKALDLIKDLVEEVVSGNKIVENPNSLVDKIINYKISFPVDSSNSPEATPKTNDVFDQIPKKENTVRSEDVIEYGAIPHTPKPEEEPVTVKQDIRLIDESSKNFVIDTVRVASNNLDTLMNLSGELTVTNLRLIQRFNKIEGIISLLEESARAVSQQRFSTFAKPSEQGGGNNNDLLLKAESEKMEQLLDFVYQLKAGLNEDTSRLDFVTNRFEEIIKDLRVLPLSHVFNLFPRMVRDMSQTMGKLINFKIEGEGIKADKKILEEIKDPLMHIIRNAIDHGIETPEKRVEAGKLKEGTILLSAKQSSSTIIIEIDDDGAGLDSEQIKKSAIKKGLIKKQDAAELSDSQIFQLIFSPGFSTAKLITDVSGRGVGLEVVLANVQKLKGTIGVDTKPGKGTKFKLEIPVTLATLRIIIVRLNNEIYAIPVEYVKSAISVKRSSVFSLDGCDAIIYEEKPVSVFKLEEILEIKNTEIEESAKEGEENFECILISVMGETIGLFVDEILDEQEALVKPLGMMLKRVRNVTGSAILGSGDVCIVLNPVDIHKSVKLNSGKSSSTVAGKKKKDVKKIILLVEDSLTTRTQEKRILEGAGFTVITAVDGVEGFQKLSGNKIDLIVSDIEMPNLDGLSFTKKVRAEKKFSSLPVVLVTSLSSDEQKQKGLDAGANAYITKSNFDQKLLLETIARLL
ncbi:MAG: hybrid sensor histidine kinase/response regulator [Ignavibacteriaceae bacterium]|nr:hybrid sensor histidine kinase/response regulator [Ignavibacteriaceae bacterium]